MDADLRNSARTTRARENIKLEGIDIDIDIGDEFYKNLFLPFRRIHLEFFSKNTFIILILIAFRMIVECRIG